MPTRVMPEFEDTPAGQKRSVFFTIGVGTGFISIVAATAALIASAANTPIAAVLIILGSMAFGFSTMTAMGRLEGLYGDD